MPAPAVDVPGVRQGVHGRPDRWSPGGIVTYDEDALYDELAFVGAHYHWSLAEILDLEHATQDALHPGRRRSRPAAAEACHVAVPAQPWRRRRADVPTGRRRTGAPRRTGRLAGRAAARRRADVARRRSTPTSSATWRPAPTRRSSPRSGTTSCRRRRPVPCTASPGPTGRRTCSPRRPAAPRVQRIVAATPATDEPATSAPAVAPDTATSPIADPRDRADVVSPLVTPQRPLVDASAVPLPSVPAPAAVQLRPLDPEPAAPEADPAPVDADPSPRRRTAARHEHRASGVDRRRAVDRAGDVADDRRRCRDACRRAGVPARSRRRPPRAHPSCHGWRTSRATPGRPRPRIGAPIERPARADARATPRELGAATGRAATAWRQPTRANDGARRRRPSAPAPTSTPTAAPEPVATGLVGTSPLASAAPVVALERVDAAVRRRSPPRAGHGLADRRPRRRRRRSRRPPAPSTDRSRDDADRAPPSRRRAAAPIGATGPAPRRRAGRRRRRSARHRPTGHRSTRRAVDDRHRRRRRRAPAPSARPAAGTGDAGGADRRRRLGGSTPSPVVASRPRPRSSGHAAPAACRSAPARCRHAAVRAARPAARRPARRRRPGPTIAPPTPTGVPRRRAAPPTSSPPSAATTTDEPPRRLVDARSPRPSRRRATHRRLTVGDDAACGVAPRRRGVGGAGDDRPGDGAHRPGQSARPRPSSHRGCSGPRIRRGAGADRSARDDRSTPSAAVTVDPGDASPARTERRGDRPARPRPVPAAAPPARPRPAARPRAPRLPHRHPLLTAT